MADKRVCMGCEDVSDSSHMFKGIFHVDGLDMWTEQVYCSDCLANIVKDDPAIISHLEAI